MTQTGFALDAWLDRLGLSDLPDGAEGLAISQEAQARAIPFETIDPFLGVEPGVTSDVVAAKILNGGRGGYCFELNRLLQDALEALGFTVERRLARVRMGAAQGGPRSHLALVVPVAGARWLVDAGFGGPGPLVPLQLDSDGDQQAPNGLYRLHTDPVTAERVLYRRDPEGDFALYGLDEAHVLDPDIVSANFVCCHWPGSRFPREFMVNGYDGSTRLALRDRVLSEGGTRRPVPSVEAFATILRDRLHLPLAEARITELWDKTAG